MLLLRPHGRPRGGVKFNGSFDMLNSIRGLPNSITARLIPRPLHHRLHWF